MLSPSDFTVPENEILDEKDRLKAEYRKNADRMMLWEAVGEASGETAQTLDRVLKEADSMMIGQACTLALFDHINSLVEIDIEEFIAERKRQLCEEHEERIHRRASGE